jgi:PadR family transcriptional regulator, regulatory protein PadR
VDCTAQWLIQVRKGVVELLVLRLLATRGELHGYALVKELLAIGPLVAGESTVYPVLKRLETDGMLVSHWVPSEAGPPRKYYALSAEGTTFLAHAQCEWDSLARSVARLNKEDNGE